MMSPSSAETVPRDRRLLGLLLLGAVLLTALLPWWRNRGYVRDFFDYGVIMGATGRMEQGQLPYTGFVTPIQTSWYVWNWAAERLAGGNFQAMTWSGAASIVISILVLTLILARRWPWWAAVLVAGAISCASVSQHTLLWYNPWGVVLLATVAWAGAIAPVLRRGQAGWHLLTAAALFLGGINKINMQLMALGLAAGWAVRAMLTGGAGWRRLLATLGFHAVAGVVLPVLAEMAWTGASFALWWHNVIAQLAEGRTGMVLAALRWEFLFKPCHDYYGTLRLPQVGLVGVILTGVTLAAIWRNQRGGRDWLERILAGACGLIALLGGLILFSTNMDIAYIALAGWFALLVALWLGFGLPARGPWFLGGVIVPALVIGAVAWESAWQGQRSQFGYSHAPRNEYRSGALAGPEFSYLEGTRVPPELFASIEAVGKWRAALPANRRAAMLYSGGSEWMAHIWPAPPTPELPLYILGGWQFGPREYAATRKAVKSGAYQEIMVSLVLDHWTPELVQILGLRYNRQSLGGVFYHYSWLETFSGAPLQFLQSFGGTVDARKLSSPGDFFPLHDQPGKLFIGTSTGRETMKLTLGTNRLQGQVVVSRLGSDLGRPLAADFTIFAEYDADQRYPRWSQHVVLPAGQSEVLVDYSIDSSSLPVRFYVEIPPGFAGQVAAGWRGPVVYHSALDLPATPEWLYRDPKPVSALKPEEIARILPADRTWTPDTVYLRGGRVTAQGLELEEGGELWIRASGFVTEFSGIASLTGDRVPADTPHIHGIWLKGARMEDHTRKRLLAPGQSADFRTWCGEPDGWLIVAIDPMPGTPPVRLQINRFVHPN